MSFFVAAGVWAILCPRSRGCTCSPYVVLESDLARFRWAKKLGHTVVFGDAMRKRVLEATGASRARMVVITFDRRRGWKASLHNAHAGNANILSIVSATSDREATILVKAGASTVSPWNFAAGLALADQVQLSYGFSQGYAAQGVTAVRAELGPALIGRLGIVKLPVPRLHERKIESALAIAVA